MLKEHVDKAIIANFLMMLEEEVAVLEEANSEAEVTIRNGDNQMNQERTSKDPMDSIQVQDSKDIIQDHNMEEKKVRLSEEVEDSKDLGEAVHQESKPNHKVIIDMKERSLTGRTIDHLINPLISINQ